LFLPILFACEDPSDIGSSLISTNQVSVFFTDSLTVRTSTLLLDSVNTTNVNILLAGKYNDPLLGQTEARTYFELANIDSLAAAPQRVDSVVLKLVYTSVHYAYGDTNRTMTLNAFGLNESMSTSAKYLNYSTIPYNNTPLGRTTFRPSPVVFKSAAKDTVARFDTVRIRMSSAFMSYLASVSTKTQSRFKSEFKGFAIVPNASDNAAILGFSASFSRMEMFYKDADGNAKKLIYYPSLVNGLGTEQNARFNYVQANRQGTPLSSLNKVGTAIATSQTNNLAYFQTSAGIVTKVEFPSLVALRNSGKVAINKAELVFEVAPNTATSQTPLPTIVALANVNDENQILKNSDGTRSFVLTEAQNAVAQQEISANKITYNLTSYMESLMKGRRTNKGIVLMAPIDNSVRRMVLQGKPKLNIYYTYLPN
jgi:hypothetical protein